jgi:hypothetical protein
MLVLAVALLGSIAPDFDFLPGIAIGEMRRFHHGISHSLAFALLFGAVVFVVAHAVDRAVAVRASILAALAYASHTVLDFISVNEGTRGVPLLWPLSDERLGFSLHLFGHFRYGDISEGIWSVARWVNVSPLLRELLILGTLAVVLLRKEQIRRAFAGGRAGMGTRRS